MMLLGATATLLPINGLPALAQVDLKLNPKVVADGTWSPPPVKRV
jgi:hypothetical protein